MINQLKTKNNIKAFISLLFIIAILISCGGGGGGGGGDDTPTTSTPSTSTFSISTIDSTGNVGEYTSLAIGSVHISYYDATDPLDGDLKYGFCSSDCNQASNWSVETADNSTDVGEHSSIGVDVSDKAHISYYDYENGTVKYATNASGGWFIESPDPLTDDPSADDVGEYSSLALDSSGKVHISYYDWDNMNLKYATNASGSWIVRNDIVTTTNDVGTFSSIAVDGSDKVHIVYADYDGAKNTLKYVTDSTGSWTDPPETPDTSGNDLGDSASITVQSDGTVHISYYDLDATTLKYATNTTGSWVVETPDTSGDDVGDYSSIALDSNNNVHISYYDWDNLDLKYATNASGSWVVSTIDNTNDVGMYSSIALDPSDDSIHISYYDYTNENLKYAVK